ANLRRSHQGAVDCAVRGDGEERGLLLRRELCPDMQLKCDRAHPSRVRGHAELGGDGEPIGRNVVPGGEAAGVEADARGQTGNEELCRSGGGVLATVGCRLIDADGVLTDRDAEPVPGLIVDPHPAARLSVVGHAVVAATSARTAAMSRSRTAAISWASEAAGNAPGWENTRMPSRKAMRVGMDMMLRDLARAGSASVSTLPNTTSGCSSAAAPNTGAKARQGPHQAAQKSTRTMPSWFTVSAKVFALSAIVDMITSSVTPGGILTTPLQYTPWGILSTPEQPPCPLTSRQ